MFGNILFNGFMFFSFPSVGVNLTFYFHYSFTIKNMSRFKIQSV